ncbi:hypothetical protein HG15A2_18930 [Adhaeretor mobilis]|uniref:Uncharacterized protein n=1 Tax=Adhaeretor mobilis TaxID=1930276 RepID=A0A517MUQ4_9BACT|nr:hypothetical protein HG15A2_18930 [Adhaeretor mobilis]
MFLDPPVAVDAANSSYLPIAHYLLHSTLLHDINPFMADSHLI